MVVKLLRAEEEAWISPTFSFEIVVSPTSNVFYIFECPLIHLFHKSKTIRRGNVGEEAEALL